MALIYLFLSTNVEFERQEHLDWPILQTVIGSVGYMSCDRQESTLSCINRRSGI